MSNPWNTVGLLFTIILIITVHYLQVWERGQKTNWIERMERKRQRQLAYEVFYYLSIYSLSILLLTLQAWALSVLGN